MKKSIFSILTLVTILILTSCGMTGNQPSKVENLKDNKKNTSEDASELKDSTNETDKTSQEEAIETVIMPNAIKLLEDMTLEEKVGQLFIIRPDALKSNFSLEEANDSSSCGVIEVDEEIKKALSSYPIGGVALFGKNIVEPNQVINLNEDLQKASKTPLFIGVDEEGGMVARIGNASGFSVPYIGDMEAIGSTDDPNKAKEIGLTIGTYLKEYGFNLNFSPVADVNTNPHNIVIGNRSFGSDPKLVAEMVSAEIEGLHERGIITSLKHFPGHGDTRGDTHDGYVSVDKTWEELKACELIPFMAGIEANSDMVMLSHITTPNIDYTGLPASLNPELIDGKLRGEMGFEGVIITDSMEMGAIANQYSSAEAAVKAILAGVDIILMPQNFVEAYEGILQAVNEGIISEQRIDESLLRILSLKEQYELIK